LQRLRDSAGDAALQEEWFSVKAQAKKRAAAKIESLTGIKVNPNALFDVQVGPAAPVMTHTHTCHQRA
jgi:starch phosphorylase